jgi:hypothetical protein
MAHLEISISAASRAVSGARAKMEREHAHRLRDALHWSGRVLSIFFFALLALFMTGEGPPPISTLTIGGGLELIGLALIFVGYAIGWRHPATGGALSLFGVAAVHLIEALISGKSAGWAFSLLAIPGALHLAASYCGSERLAKVH